MIYEDTDLRKYLFIHNPRTGGTNITHFLEAYTNAKNYIHPELEGFWRHLTVSWCHLNLDDYYPFGFVRNPFDREYSLYTLFKARDNTPECVRSYDSFKHWIVDGFYVEPGHRYYGLHKYRFPQHTLFDERCHVFKYEERTEALAEIAKNIYVDADTLINYRGKVHTFKSNHVDYRTMYDQEMIDIVYPYFKQDLEKYGYSFE